MSSGVMKGGNRNGGKINGGKINGGKINGGQSGVRRQNWPAVDVVIPVYEPDEKLEKLLRRLLVQSCPISRILIMKTEPQDWSETEIEPLFKGTGTQLSVIGLHKEEFDHGGTRDLGIRKSDAQVCICMTQDAVPRDHYLVERLLEALYSEEEKTAAAYARQLPASGCRVIERYTREFNYTDESRIKTLEDLPELGVKTYFCSNVCAAYRRDRYLKLGGFITKTIFNEDMIFAAKAVQAGYGIAYAADAQVIHSHNYTGLKQLRRNFDLAVSQADHPEIFKGISSEGEGIRLVRRTGQRLIRSGFWYLLPELIYQSGMKYLGFWLGKRYHSLPPGLISRLTMNRGYWK